MKTKRALRVLGFCFVLLGCLAASAGSQTNPQPQAKKVWTNDDVEGLRGTAPVSAPGAPGPSKSAQPSSADRSAGVAHAIKVQSYRQQLQPLYAQLPKIDAEITQMKAFQDGSYQSTGGVARFGAQPLNPADRINVLEKQKAGVQSQIDEIEDKARHDGVLPGELR